MRYKNVYLKCIEYELAPVVVTSSELESRIKSLYDILHLQPGHLEALTGIVERRWWEPNTPLHRGAATAASKALETSGIAAQDIGALIYAGVCREHIEPATACRVAYEIGINSTSAVYDVSNACLGVLNGMIDIANRIELGQIRAGMVISCETAREINEFTIERMLEEKTLDCLVSSLATLTLGSGAVAVILTDGSFAGDKGHQLLGGILRTAPKFHHLSRWGLDTSNGEIRPFMETDSVSVLKHGLELSSSTWNDFLKEVDWSSPQLDKVICHQVGVEHQKQALKVLGVADDKDFTSYECLGNMGTASLPVTAALAAQRGFLRRGDRVGFFGIGSGLNCLMLGLNW